MTVRELRRKLFELPNQELEVRIRICQRGRPVYSISMDETSIEEPMFDGEPVNIEIVIK